MYGSRGASGVIEIKTKKGTGRGFEISYDGNYGFESMYKHLQMLNGPEYIATAVLWIIIQLSKLTITEI